MKKHFNTIKITFVAIALLGIFIAPVRTEASVSSFISGLFTKNLGGGDNTVTPLASAGKAKISGADTTAGFLIDKLVAGTNITLTKNNAGGNETLTIASTGGSGSVAWGAITGTLSSQTDLQSALDAKVPTTRTISTTSPLTGGGDLSANRTIAIPAATTSANGYLTSTDWNTFNGKQAPITLTTTGTSGAASFLSNTLNIPNYTYTLPTASTSVLGGVKVDGTSITISGGVISAAGGGGGTVTSVTSADANATVANTTTTPVITIVAAPKLETGRTISVSGDLAYTSPSFDGSGNVTAAGTLATVNSNVGSFGSATQTGTFTVNGKGLITAAGNTTITPAIGSITGLGTGIATFLATPSSSNLASAVTDETGSGPLVFATSPSLTGATLDTTTTGTTQIAGDSSSKLATTAFVANAILGQDFKEAAKYATTGALPSIIYNNGSSGVGATLTGVGFGAISLDSNTPSVGDRVLVKNQVSSFQNGIYTVTTVGNVAAVFVLTRTTDFNQSSEIDAGDTVFVSSGTTLSTTTWAYNGIDAPTMGTTAITFAQTAGQGSFTGGNGITITGTSVAIDTSITVDKTTAQILTNKDLTSGTNTFPTFNQNTTGSAAKWTTARNLAGNSVDGSANVAFANKFIVQGTSDAGLSGPQFLGALGTGLVKNTISTGVLSIAAAGTDYLAPTGSGASLTGIPTSIAGTTNQITASASTGAVTLSIPSNFVPPGGVAPNGLLQTSGTSSQLGGSTNTEFVFSGGSGSLTLAASNSWANYLAPAITVTEASSGIHPVVSNVGIAAINITNGTATTTTAASLYIAGAPTGTAVATNSFAEFVAGGGEYLKGGLTLAGSSSGTTVLNPAATASGTLTLPAATDTLVGQATTDTLTNKTITATSNNVTANSLRSATTSVDVSTATAPTSGQVLTATSTTAATWQGAPAPTSTSGVSTGPSASSTQTITHSLGRIPKTIELIGMGRLIGNPSSTTHSDSTGFFTSSGNTSIHIVGNIAAAGSTDPVTSTAFAIYLDNGTSTTVSGTGVIQNVTSTSFDIVWTLVGSGLTQTNFIWTAT